MGGRAWSVVGSACSLSAAASAPPPAPPVTETFLAADLPVAHGGPITAGDYRKTAVTSYTGPGGMNGVGTHTEKTVARFGPGHFEFVTVADGTPQVRFAGMLSTTNAEITLTRTCPSPAVSPLTRFDSDGTRVVLYDPVRRLALTYARR